MNSKKRIALLIAGSLVAVFAISLNLANKTSQSEIARQSFYDEEIAVTTTTTTTTTVPNVVTTISSVTVDTTPSTSMTKISLKRQLQAIHVDEINEWLISTEQKEEITASTSEISKKSETTSTSKKKTKKKKKNKAKTTTKKVESSNYEWNGPVLNSFAGIVQGPSGNETFYNLDMSGVISIMQNQGYNYTYWVREDGVKMYGDYVMVAADLSIRPRGSLIPTSLGMGIVCDTGGFVSWDNTRLDIATTW